MRRLIIEISGEDFSQFDESSSLSLIKSYEILHILRFDNDEFAAVLKIAFKDAATKLEDIIGEGDLTKPKIQLLEKDANGTFTYFLAGKLHQSSMEKKFLSFGGYLSTPFEIRDGKIKIAFLGDPKQIKKLLEYGDEVGLRYRVVSLTDAKFSPESPLSSLTDKQRQVLVSAFEHGYYETPRRTSSKDLAKKLDLKTSTLVEHRRKAEQRLLAQIIKEA